MGNRNRVTFDLDVNDREILLSRVRERTGADSDSAAFDEMLRMTLDHMDVLEGAREEIRQLARERSGDYYRVNVDTRVSRDERRR